MMGSATLRLASGITVTVCSACAVELQQLQEQSKPNQSDLAWLTSGAKDLAEALRYDPSNDHAKTNLDEVNKVLSQFGSARVRVPRLRQVASASDTLDEDFRWTPKLIIGLIVAAVAIAYLIVLGIG